MATVKLRLIFLVSALAALGLTAVPAGSTPALFGSTEIKNTNLKPFPKWTKVLKRIRADGKGKAECKAGAAGCPIKDWEELVTKLKGKSKRTQLDEVNKFMNRWKYIVDKRNWNKKDFWASPKQFFERDGDCEDYAIAKFTTLRALGWSNDEMRIIIVQDKNLKIGHAVLVAYLDNKALILDNQIKKIVPSSTVTHYKPFFSMNEEAWWLHRPLRKKKRKKKK